MKRWAAFALGLAALGCGTYDDVVSVTSLEEQAALQADGGALREGEVRVVANPLVEWPFELAPWPLSTPLDEFFAGSAGVGSVVVDGRDAELLLELLERVQSGEFGPQQSAVAVEDENGTQYLVVIQTP